MPDPKFSPGPDQPEHQTKQTNSDIQVNRVYSICSSGRILVRYIIDEYSINEKYILYYSIQCYKNFSCIFSLNLDIGYWISGISLVAMQCIGECSRSTLENVVT